MLMILMMESDAMQILGPGRSVIVSKLVDQFDSDRIGLVMFAGKALTLFP